MSDVLSLDAPVTNSERDEVAEVALLDTLIDQSIPIEDKLCNQAEYNQLFEELNKLMPEAIIIGRLRQKGYSGGQD